MCRVKGSGRKSMSEETVDKIRQKVVNSPKKLIRRTSFETQIPATTFWRVIKKRLQMRPYKLQLVRTFLDCSQLFGKFYLPFLLTLTFSQILLLCTSNLLPQTFHAISKFAFCRSIFQMHFFRIAKQRSASLF